MTRKKAIQLAIDALERRRRVYAVGHNACIDGMSAFVFCERDHKKYIELSEAIEELTPKPVEKPLASMHWEEMNSNG